MPAGYLWLQHDPHRTAAPQLRAEAEALGVEGRRIAFTGWLSDEVRLWLKDGRP